MVDWISQHLIQCSINELFHRLPILLEVQATSAIAAPSNDLLVEPFAAVSGPHNHSSSHRPGSCQKFLSFCPPIFIFHLVAQLVFLFLSLRLSKFI